MRYMRYMRGPGNWLTIAADALAAALFVAVTYFTLVAFT